MYVNNHHRPERCEIMTTNSKIVDYSAIYEALAQLLELMCNVPLLAFTAKQKINLICFCAPSFPFKIFGMLVLPKFDVTNVFSELKIVPAISLQRKFVLLLNIGMP